jgi:diamine N-acetyltransferase
MLEFALPKGMQNVYLRSLTLEDLPRVLRWHNDPELYTTLGGAFRYVSPEAERIWFDRMLEARDQVNLAICIGGTDEHIGNIYLRNIDWVSRHAELHTFIGDARQRGKGFGKQAVRLLLTHAFDDLGLTRVFLHVLADNQAAVSTYERCGFAAEGRLRAHYFKKGEYKDVLVMGMLRTDLK